MVTALLLLAATTLGGNVFPERMCDELPEADPQVNAWVADVAPDLSATPLRELPEEAALGIFHRAVRAGWGGIDLFTDDVFREPCAFYLSRETLRAIDRVFAFDLLTVIRDRDEDGREFEMLAMIAGRGKLRAFYERSGIVYRNDEEERDFELASRVEFNTPARGRLENVSGLCTEVVLLGCLDIHSLVKAGDGVEIRAGAFSADSPLTPIKLRGEATDGTASRTPSSASADRS